MHLLEFNKSNLNLSLAEARSLLGFKTIDFVDNFAAVDHFTFNLAKRLAYTKNVFKILFVESESLILNKKYPFKEIKGDYKVYTINIAESLSKELIDFVWHSSKNPKVNLKNPNHEIFFIKLHDKIYCCLRVFRNEDDFNSRKAHKRLAMKPVSLDPRLARCLVNLTGCKKGEIIDPMCGTGGILLEAAICGLNAKGYDINDEMIKISAENLSATKSKIEKKDFFTIKKKINYLATDLPYGKNTGKLDLSFYDKFLIQLDVILGVRAAVVFPGHIKVNELFEKNNLKNIQLKETFDIYVHKSMTRRVCLIETSA
jgi:tRNA (guanine10-N2)-dimethyltransferase